MKYIKEFKSKTKRQDFNLKRVKEDVLNSELALFKGKEMVFKYLNTQNNQSNQVNRINPAVIINIVH